ncbi:hypothetical protein B296_00047896, partial [Ensete ventricosum]
LRLLFLGIPSPPVASAKCCILTGRILALGGIMSDHDELRSGSGESLALPLTRCVFSVTQSYMFSSLLLAFLMVYLYLVWDPNRFRDSPQLVALLKEMKDGLDVVRSKVDVLTQKVVGKIATPGDKEKKFQDEEDPLKYRPNPDMLDAGGVYRPPRFAPTSMDEDKISKQEKQALRREKALLRQAKQSTYVKELMDDIEDRPEEVGGSLFLLIKI